MIDKKTLRSMRRELYDLNRNYQPGIFTEIPESRWPASFKLFEGMPLSNVYRSRDFLVQVFKGEFTRLSICRTSLNESGHFEDGISWEELQGVKTAIGYGDCDAVEAYPKNSDVVNVANFRHLWIVPAEYATFFWRGGCDPNEKSNGIPGPVLAYMNRVSGK